MASRNLVILIGHLGRDPELKYLPTGTTVTNFSLATKEKNRNEEERTEWHSIVAFGKLAEVCDEYLKKGSLVYVEGSLRTRSWDDKDGNKRSKTEITCNNMQILDKKKPNTGDNAGLAHGSSSSDDDVPF